MSLEVAGTIWKESVKIADENNESDEFMAFCSYEYTSQWAFRNVFFRNCAKVPEMSFSALESWHFEDLWKWMDVRHKAGNEVPAISHNANLSDGWMYPIDVESFGRPIGAAWAASRARHNRGSRSPPRSRGGRWRGPTPSRGSATSCSAPTTCCSCLACCCA